MAARYKAHCLVSLGSNVGDRHALLNGAIDGLRQISDGKSVTVSDRLQSEPIGGPSGQLPFVNAVAELSVACSASELLASLQRIEADHDRQRSQRWAARSLDLDLLLYETNVVRSHDLRLPHPRMSFRRFVLGPACQLAGDWLHPECDKTLKQLLDRLDYGHEAVALRDDDGAVRNWITRWSGDLAIVDFDSSTGPLAKLTIDCSPEARSLPPCGPRLVLADCPREHWRHEVEAALSCVWPDSKVPLEAGTTNPDTAD